MTRLLRWRLRTALALVLVAALLLGGYRMASDRRHRYLRAADHLHSIRGSNSDVEWHLWRELDQPPDTYERLMKQLRVNLEELGVDPGDNPEDAYFSWRDRHERLVRSCKVAAQASALELLLVPIDPACGCTLCESIAGRGQAPGAVSP